MIQLNPLGTHRSTGRTWTVVLAGGEGARLSPTIERWLGEKRPKQYCTFVGRRSMLQHTLDRARRLAPPERMVTVIGRHHSRYVRDAVGDPRPGLWLRQPRNRGTAAGVFLALTHVLARDPQAIVALLPSDHFIWPEDRFVRRMRQALAAVRGSGKMILLGARADRPEVEYGWIVPGDDLATDFRDVRLHSILDFSEKPKLADAERLLRGGALWNTMVTVARARSLWRLGRTLHPRLMAPFDTLRRMLTRDGTDMDAARVARGYVQAAYATLPHCCFSRDLLERAHRQSAVMALDGVKWCDWGRPERIAETLETLGQEPAFMQPAARARRASLAPLPAERG
jgi:mannose-1-phosphate guanylyltransferase